MRKILRDPETVAGDPGANPGRIPVSVLSDDLKCSWKGGALRIADQIGK